MNKVHLTNDGMKKITISSFISFLSLQVNKFMQSEIQKQLLRGLPKKKYSQNMQQIHRRKAMPNFDFNKVALQLY